MLPAVHVGGDAVDHRMHSAEVGGHDGQVRPVGGRAQVNPWREPSASRCASQSAHCRSQLTSSHSRLRGRLAAVEFRVIVAIGLALENNGATSTGTL
jgi:hypothetical protein